jgi:DNA-binding transcriptional ArsR family regulator
VARAPSARARRGRTATAAPELDPLIHERVRLAIVSALAVRTRLSFSELLEVVGATDGNLSAHARKLEEAGYVRAAKRFAGRQPRTEYALTPRGRRALERYLDQMEELIRTVRPPAGPAGEA